jgi:hypothetical protein
MFEAMRMNKQITLTLLALVAAMIAGCAASARPDNANGAGANAAISSASQPESKPQSASPYSQPLMATGGDMVMLHVASRGIAG